MYIFFYWAPLHHVSNFFYKTELLDKFSKLDEVEAAAVPLAFDRDLIGFHHATFSWSNEPNGSETPGTRSTLSFRLRISEKLLFKRGCLNLIVGPTGSGKTSLLLALLGRSFVRGTHCVHLLFEKANYISSQSGPIHGLICHGTPVCLTQHKSLGC
jgi:hypothetical protein